MGFRTDAVLPDGSILPGAGFAEILEITPITGFVCLIEYEGEIRHISCRRYDRIGEVSHIGAICSSARAYRQFRSDKVLAVFDAETGEHVGAGSYFERFAVDRVVEKKDYWGLVPTQHRHLLAGLNVLAFLAHCDGRWHPLEQEVIEDFACSLWMRKEWEGDPPLEEISLHARRLAPDGSVFGAALRNMASSASSVRLLKAFASRVVAADGRISDDEFNWMMHFEEMLAEYTT